MEQSGNGNFQERRVQAVLKKMEEEENKRKQVR